MSLTTLIVTNVVLDGLILGLVGFVMSRAAQLRPQGTPTVSAHQRRTARPRHALDLKPAPQAA